MKTRNRDGRGTVIHRGGIFLTCAVILAVLVVALILQPEDAAAFRNVKPGDAIPEVTLKDISGGTLGLSDFAGKPKMIIFFSGNDRSKKVVEIAEQLYQNYKDEGFAIIAIYTGSDRAEGKSIAEESKATYPVLLDTDRSAYAAFGIMVTPVMALVDKEDKLTKEQSYVPLLEGILDVEVKVALGKMTREEADLSLKPEEAPEVSEEEKEAAKLYNLGLILLERGMKDKAVEKFKEVLEVDPAFCAVRLQLGQIYLDDGKVDEAKQEFEYVLKCDPQSHEAKVGMGTVFGLEGEYDKAIEMIQSSLMLNPRPELANYELGKIYEKKGELDKAVASYKKALERLLSK